MASNYGLPPPPPPPHSYAAPSQGQGTNGNGRPQVLPHSHSPAQQQHQLQMPSMMHFSNPQLSQHQTIHQLNPANSSSYPLYQYYQTSQLNYQYQQAQHYQQTPYYSQCSYSPYANYTALPPPPPPPPPRSNTNQQICLNSTFKGPNKIDTQEHSRQSLALASPTKILSNDQPKKINDKMVKKYSGRGLKIITISGPGLRPQKFKICVGNHPDDIKQWIEERRRRFPRRDGSHRNNGEVVSAGCKRIRHEDDEGNVASKQSCVDDNEVVGATCNDESGGTSGLSSLLGGYDSSSSSEDGSSESKNKTTIDHAGLPLGDESAKTSIAVVEPSQSQSKRICKYYQRGKCHHGDSCKFLHNDSNDNSPNRRQKPKMLTQSDRDKARNRFEEELQMLGLATPGHGNRYSSGEKVITNTSLLHKLLQRDKERERRLTLQLLRYIVDCDYFRGGDTSESCYDSVGDE